MGRLSRRLDHIGSVVRPVYGLVWPIPSGSGCLVQLELFHGRHTPKRYGALFGQKAGEVRLELTTTGESTPSAYRSHGGKRPSPLAYLWRFQRLIREWTTLFASRLSVTHSITTTELSPALSQTELLARDILLDGIALIVYDSTAFPTAYAQSPVFSFHASTNASVLKE